MATVKHVTILANGASVEFDCKKIELQTSLDAATYGELAGYNIDTEGTYYDLVYINPRRVDVVVVLGEDVVSSDVDASNQVELPRRKNRKEGLTPTRPGKRQAAHR